MSYWTMSAEAGPSRSPQMPSKSFSQDASAPTKPAVASNIQLASASKHESHVPTFLVRSATEHDLYHTEHKSLHTFAYGGLAHTSPSAEAPSTMSPPAFYRTTFSNPSSSSVSSSGHPKSPSHRNSFSSVSVSELDSSSISDSLPGHSFKRESKRGSQDARNTANVHPSDTARKDAGRHRSHTEGSQFALPNSGDVFIYSSHNLEASSHKFHQPRFLHQRRKPDDPQRSRFEATSDMHQRRARSRPQSPHIPITVVQLLVAGLSRYTRLQAPVQGQHPQSQSRPRRG